jgi:hypothetical protein
MISSNTIPQLKKKKRKKKKERKRGKRKRLEYIMYDMPAPRTS